MRVRPIFLACLLLAGCSKHNDVGGTAKLKAFLARTDIILIKRFFGSKGVDITAPPDKRDADGIYNTWRHGYVSIEPITVEEANRSNKQKGIEISVLENQWTVGGYGPSESSPERADSSFLDEDEAVDLDAALAYMEDAATGWDKRPPEPRQTEVQFRSKDTFELALAPHNPSAYTVECGSAAVTLDQSQLRAFHANLKTALDVLKKN